MNLPVYKVPMIMAYASSTGGLGRMHLVTGKSEPNSQNFFQSTPKIACEQRSPGSGFPAFDGAVEIDDLERIGCSACMSYFVQSAISSATTHQLLYLLDLLVRKGRRWAVSHSEKLNEATSNIVKELQRRPSSTLPQIAAFLSDTLKVYGKSNLFFEKSTLESYLNPVLEALGGQETSRSDIAAGMHRKGSPESTGGERQQQVSDAPEQPIKVPLPAPHVPLEDKEERCLLAEVLNGNRQTATGQPIRLPLELRGRMCLSPDQRGLYLFRYKEEVNHSTRWTLCYFDLSTDTLQDLTDVGTSNYFGPHIGALAYFFRMIKPHSTNHLLCYHGTRRVDLTGGDIPIRWASAMGQALYIKTDDKSIVTDEEGVRCVIPHGRTFDEAWTDPRRGRILGSFRKYDEVKKSIDYDTPARYLLLLEDDGFSFQDKEPILEETLAKRYAIHDSVSEDELLVLESIDQNGDGICDYKDRHNELLIVLDLSTGKTRTLLEGRRQFCLIQAHSDGYIFWIQEEERNALYSGWIMELASGRTSKVTELHGACFRFFLDKNWSTLYWQVIQNTVGDGKYYYVENKSWFFKINLVTA